MTDETIFEAMIWDVDLPSMTARFRIPPGLPFATGIYEIRRVRRPTDEDHARWAHLPEPRDDDDDDEELDALVAENERLRGALEPFAKSAVLEPNGSIIGLERYHFDRARSALSTLAKEQSA